MSLSMLDVIKATNKSMSPMGYPTVLAYGNTKTGKTQLLATVAKFPGIKRIYWFDLENGSETIRKMYAEGLLTEEEVAKIILIKVADTRDSPTAIRTMLKALCTRNPVNICQVDGVIDSEEGRKNDWPFVKFHYAGMTGEDAIVIDTLSQLGTSASNLATLSQAVEYKLQLDDYGSMGKWLADVLSTIQAAKYCPFFCATHAIGLENNGTLTRIVPQCGSRNFSEGVGKYFGTVIYMSKMAKKHQAVSTTGSNSLTDAGSRLGIKLDGKATLDLGEELSSLYGAEGSVTTERQEVPKQETAGEPAKKSSILDKLKK